MLQLQSRYIPAAREAKAHLDHVIDLCGTPPKGRNTNVIVLYMILPETFK